MVTKKQQNLFEELGVLTEAEPVNPYHTLGIDPNFVRDLLQEDPSGKAVRTFASAAYRGLSQLYHPDNSPDNADKFRTITGARDQITEATTDGLSRWSRVQRASRAVSLDSLSARVELVLNQSAETIQSTMRFGRDPLHFTQERWAQGILLEHGSGLLLARRSIDDAGLRVTKAVDLSTDRIQRIPAGDNKEVLFDFRNFLDNHDSFGIEPGAPVRAFVDGDRATILNDDLSFMMDVSEPVADFRRIREMTRGRDDQRVGGEDAWLRRSSPSMYRTSSGGTKASQRPLKIWVFQEHIRADEQTSHDLGWNIPFFSAGSVAPNYYQKMKHSKESGRLALRSAQLARHEHAYFNWLPVTVRSLIDENASYSPVIATGNSLLLYDAASDAPIATDTKIIGLLGNNAYSPDPANS
ncbi:MAG TPA: hypothetical protein VG604_03105 [Candidatus Saccharimonadales bacterium]|nr:hypothetical protein [Candidatus Saccharimonadales bacterium]